MTPAWRRAVTAIGLSDAAAEAAAEQFDRAWQRHQAQFGAAPRRAWWIPGRIEVLGKHTDYGGGRSLLCAVERGFHIVAAPRNDGIVHIVDASTGAALVTRLQPDIPNRPRHWTDYPITVVRRVARDFPGAATGMNVALVSSLPSASGLSSSSALVIACFLPLAAFNGLDRRAEWPPIAEADHLAEYLGAVENGLGYGPFRADRGVGTLGGAEDQTAITRATAGALLQYHFIPVTREAVIPLPEGWTFVVAMSGAHAPKGAAVQARYNALAKQIAALLQLCNDATGRSDRSLFTALGSSPEAYQRLRDAVRSGGGEHAGQLTERLEQFHAEIWEIIPEVARHLASGHAERIGDAVARSQALAESVLGNQIAETIHLAHRAREFGAAAASAFGAGFGGSVWALVRAGDADRFLTGWRADYLRAFPRREPRAVFFRTAAGPPAAELPVADVT